MKIRQSMRDFWANPEDPRHGTYNGYGNLRCRCMRCRKANTAYNKISRVERHSRIDPDDIRHGTKSFYFNWGCRCLECSYAHYLYEKQQRPKNPQ